MWRRRDYAKRVSALLSPVASPGADAGLDDGLYDDYDDDDDPAVRRERATRLKRRGVAAQALSL